jgi:hypothetical protein
MARTRAPRPGFVLDVDRNHPPIVFHHGTGLRAERLPAGRTRVVYAGDPAPGVDAEAAIRRAVREPVGSEPLASRLRSGMKLTIAFDDLSQPLPPMRRPDARQQIIEAVLDLAAEAGVDDVQIIAARGLRRRMTEAELRHAVGDRVHDAFAPHGLLRNHDGADPAGLVVIGTTSDGEPVELDARAAASDLVIDVRVHGAATNGGHESLATTLSGYTARRGTDAARDEVLRSSGLAVFQISATLNNDAFGLDGPLAVLQKREPDWSPRDRASFLALQTALRVAPSGGRRKAFERWKAPYAVTSVHAGEPAAVRELVTQHVRQHVVAVKGQTDILTIGLPDIGPFAVNSIMNPVLVASLGLSWATDLHLGTPLVREGGVLILSHPTPWQFHPVHHPSYIDFFEKVLAETTDAGEIEQRFEARYAEDEWYRHLYRTSYAYHGAHPLHTWYACAEAMTHFGRVIVVGGEPDAVRRLGLRPASTLDDALEMASDVVGRQASITHVHTPPTFTVDVS